MSDQYFTAAFHPCVPLITVTSLQRTGDDQGGPDRSAAQHPLQNHRAREALGFEWQPARNAFHVPGYPCSHAIVVIPCLVARNNCRVRDPPKRATPVLHPYPSHEDPGQWQQGHGFECQQSRRGNAHARLGVTRAKRDQRFSDHRRLLSLHETGEAGFDQAIRKSLNADLGMCELDIIFVAQLSCDPVEGGFIVKQIPDA